eukprot:4363990-Pyramimonas_sp.AAC.1
MPPRSAQEIPQEAPKVIQATSGLCARPPPSPPQDALRRSKSASKPIPRGILRGPCSHFLCVLSASLIEAIPLGIVSGWAGGVTRA